MYEIRYGLAVPYYVWDVSKIGMLTPTGVIVGSFATLSAALDAYPTAVFNNR